MSSWLPDLSKRFYAAELMDDPQCDERKLVRSYQQLAIINRTISRMHALLSRFVLADIAQRREPAHVVEVGCGGGDMLLWLAKQAKARNLPIRLTGTDTDPRALALARKKLCGFPDVTLSELPLQRLHALEESADYVFCNHVLHHIPPDEVASALKLMRDATRVRLLVNDLRRSRFAYVSYSALARVLFHDSFTYEDGRLSIRKGFSLQELQAIAKQAEFPPETLVATAPPSRVYLLAPGALRGPSGLFNNAASR